MRISEITNLFRRQCPNLLSHEEQTRANIYRRREAYYRQSTDMMSARTLYGAKSGSLDTMAKISGLDELVITVFNLVPKVCDADRSAMMNNLTIEGFSIPSDARGSELLRGILAENNFYLLMNKLFETGISKGDIYIKVSPDPGKICGVRLSLVPPEIVFPVINPHDNEQALSYRIIYSYDERNIDGAYPLVQSSSTQRQYLEVIDQESTRIYIDGKLKESLSYQRDISGFNIYHAANIPVANDYFGLPTPYDIYDDIDLINHTLSAELERQRFYANPQVLARGISKQEQIPWGAGMIHFMDKEATMELLEWKGAPQILETLKMMVDAVKDKKPQFALDNIRHSSEAHSGIELRQRLALFIAHIALLEASYKACLQQALDYALKIAGYEPKAPIEIDFGQPIEG